MHRISQMRNFAAKLQKKIKTCKKMANKIFLAPPRGYINEIAKLARCDRKTVSTAIHHNATGAKADKVREIYRAKYMNQ